MNHARWVLPLAAACLGVGFASGASAEEVVLVSGARYDATDVRLLPGSGGSEGSVQFSFRAGAGRGTLTVGFDRVEAKSLFGIAVARADATDPRAHLALARLALAHGLLGEATYRFRRAADMDATLAPDRDAGLASVRDAQGERLLAEAAAELRRGRSDLALAKAKDVEAKAVPGSALSARAAGIATLAASVLERDRAQREAEAAKRSEAAAAAIEAAFVSNLVRADRAIGAAGKERARAADPNVGHSEALRSLASAESQLREGRRLLAVARQNAGVRTPEVDARDTDAGRILVATLLDLADLYRIDRRFDRARDHLRAAQILDPENPRVREVRDLIEQDLHTPPPLPSPDELYPPALDWTYGGYPYGVYGGTLLAPSRGYYGRPYGGCGSGFSFRWSGGSWGVLGHW